MLETSNEFAEPIKMLLESQYKSIVTKEMEKLSENLKVSKKVEISTEDEANLILITVESLVGNLLDSTWNGGANINKIVKEKLVSIMKDQGYDMVGHNISVKYHTHHEQIERCNQLCEAQTILKSSSYAQGKVLSFVNSMLKSTFPVDLFNVFSIKTEGGNELSKSIIFV